MPELPEVETLASGLRRYLLGLNLERVRVLQKGVLRNTAPRLLRRLERCRVVGLSRRGKFLLLHLSNGAVILFHLKMTGRLFLLPREEPPSRWERVQMEFTGTDWRLSFEDQRKFGYLAVLSEMGECPVPLFHELGCDALQVSREELGALLQESRRPIKALLLDQRVLAGLGNIYVDECLHRAKIHPLLPAKDVPPRHIGSLHRAMRRVLSHAIECGGSTVRNFRDGVNSPGVFQKYHRVYRRKGEKCRRCRSTIAYLRVASRGTYYCPSCQRV